MFWIPKRVFTVDDAFEKWIMAFLTTLPVFPVNEFMGLVTSFTYWVDWIVNFFTEPTDPWIFEFTYENDIAVSVYGNPDAEPWGTFKYFDMFTPLGVSDTFMYILTNDSPLTILDWPVLLINMIIADVTKDWTDHNMIGNGLRNLSPDMNNPFIYFFQMLVLPFGWVPLPYPTNFAWWYVIYSAFTLWFAPTTENFGEDAATMKAFSERPSAMDCNGNVGPGNVCWCPSQSYNCACQPDVLNQKLSR